MGIPFLNLARQYKELEAEIMTSLEGVMSRGVYILGSEVAAFEDEWASYCQNGRAAAVGVASGTDALELALVASGAVRKGQNDEVITSPLTAGYTALAILNAGATPVFADIDPQTFTLDPQAIEVAITPRTRAIVPVHLYGQMAEMAGICEIAARHNLIVIEDAAQAHGARLADPRASGYAAHARLATFSFYPTKNLGACGDGGAIVADDPEVIERLKVLRQGGHRTGLGTKTQGRNSRLDEMQAAILRVKLRRLDEWNRRRQKIARQYDDALGNHASLEIPVSREPSAHVYHLYVIQHQSRDRFRAHLAARGIETKIHYPFLLHQQPLFRRSIDSALPVAEQVVERIVSLPLYPQLTDSEVQEVITAILEDSG